MNVIAQKKLILQRAIEEQEQVIQDFETRGERSHEAAVIAYEEDHEYGHGSAGEEQDEAELFEVKVREAKADLSKLKSYVIDSPNREVEAPAVVITDKVNFFVAAALRKFEVDGEDYIGISTKAPIFEELEGKQAGEIVTFKDKNYLIKDVY